MKIGCEEVELVTDFESLRAGDVVWILGCGWCAKHHRYLLLSLKEMETEGPNGVVQTETAWDAVPEQACGSDCVAKSCAESGELYRVVDPLLDAAHVTRAKELAR
jgi:hypothetical protein